MKNLSRFLPFCFVAVALVAAGCGGGGVSALDALPDPTVRFFNLSPDSSAIGFQIDDKKLATNTAFLGSNADFTAFKFVFDDSGGSDYFITDDSNGTELARENAQFDKNTDHMILAYGKVTPGTELAKRIQMLNVGINRRIVPGKARIYIFNGYVPRLGIEPRTVNFRSIDALGSVSIAKAQYERTSLQYGAFDASASVIDVDPGTRIFQARATDSDAVVILAEGQAALASNKIYFAIIAGQEDSADPAKQGKITFVELSTRP